MKLVKPTTELRESFRSAVQEWNRQYQPGSGIRDADALFTDAGFEEWVQALTDEEQRPAQPGYVRCSYYWIVDGSEQEEVVGCIALRHELNEHLRKLGGHVGYAVRPSRRGRGYATRALEALKPLARERGIEEMLLTCDETNIASRRVIEACGGVFEDVHDDGQRRTLRYWV